LTAKMMSITPEELEGRTAYRVMTGLVVPRPIAWMSTLGKEGIPHQAPFSFYNAVSGTPPVVMVYKPPSGRGERHHAPLPGHG
jgi:flavin reductase (DIM6/NTAB) family NADH-FMN oxidoreductase RutF